MVGHNLINLPLMKYFRFNNRILFTDFLDQFSIGGFKLGFWFAQQGSIYGFVILIFVYVFAMARLEKKIKKSDEEID